MFLSKRVNAFKYAWEGCLASFIHETHLKIHAVVTLMVIVAGLYFGIQRLEWILVIMCCGLVIAAELFNSSIEKLCDVITRDLNPKIKYIKDVSAAAVLILSVCSVIVGYLVFAPYLK